MGSFSLHLELDIGLAEIEQAIGRGQQALVQGVHDAADKAAREALESVQRKHRYVDRTGTLTTKARARLTNITFMGAQSEIWWPAKYASFVDAGTRPHLIQARRAPLLAFMWHGRLIRTRMVIHPGTKPTGFAGDAYRKAEAVLEREAELAVKRAEDAINR